MRFRVETFNVLAQYLCKGDFFPYSTKAARRWKNRFPRIQHTMRQLAADVICMQEVDNHESYARFFDLHGYKSVYCHEGDRFGILIAWNTKR